MRILAWLVSLIVLTLARYAYADPYDEDDASPVVSGSVPLRERALAPAPPRSPVALAVTLFGETRVDAPATNVGILGSVTLPLERTVAREVDAVPPTPITLPVTRELAADVVRASLRAAGLADDSDLEGLARRAHYAALLPDTRLRVLKRTGQSDGVDVATSGTNYNDTYAIDDLWMEGSVTFHLERLVFATEEVAMTRAKLARIEARARLAEKAIAALAGWQRAGIERAAAIPGTPEALEAAVKLSEEEAVLEILTNGWFARWEARARPW